MTLLVRYPTSFLFLGLIMVCRLQYTRTLLVFFELRRLYPACSIPSLATGYRITVVVIWPLRYHLDLIYGAQAFKIACDTLEESFSDEPTDEEREMVEMILARGGPSHTASVVRSVCQAAFMWNDTALWQRAVRACDADRAISELESENVLNAILEFGFDAVKPWYRHSLLFLLPRLMPL